MENNADTLTFARDILSVISSDERVNLYNALRRGADRLAHTTDALWASGDRYWDTARDSYNMAADINGVWMAGTYRH